MADELYEVCCAIRHWLKTGKNPAGGCVAAPPADLACLEMVENALERYETRKLEGTNETPKEAVQAAREVDRRASILDEALTNQSVEVDALAEHFTKDGQLVGVSEWRSKQIAKHIAEAKRIVKEAVAALASPDHEIADERADDDRTST